jgi:aryl sulfotransferase
MANDLIPRRTRTYQNHHLDSTRWDRFTPRPGDVIISTSYKSGTTWMQRIVSLLLFGPGRLPAAMGELSPWVDMRLPPLEPMIERVERQEHRRFVKSHLPLDALPFFPEAHYIWVARDTRDVFMSLWNHYRSHTDSFYETIAAGEYEGSPFPRCPVNARDFWRSWISRAWFPWEPDGWPYWSHHYHAASFWPYRQLPNLLAVHYNDLQADLPGQMRRVAGFLGIAVPEEDWPARVEAARFHSMREEAIREEAETLRPDAPRIWKDGMASFFYKGTNGRWRDVLTHEDLALYERAVTALEPELRAWLEGGSQHPLRACSTGD